MGDPLAVPPPTGRMVPRWPCWILGALILVTYLGGLGYTPLVEPDEARYSEIPREMIESGDWVTPHLNYVKYFEKPPLVYWLTAINFRILGETEYAARLWPALCGLLVIGLAGVLGRAAYGPPMGAAAAGLLAVTPYHFGLSQALVLDMPLAACVAVALVAFWFGYADAGRRRWAVPLLYVAAALGVLIKGPVTLILVGGTVALFVAVRREWRVVRWVISPSGIVLFLAIAVPWFVLVSWRNPEFAQFFFVHEHLERYLVRDEHREAVWFYVPIVLGGMLPWSLVAVFAPRRAWAWITRLLQGGVAPLTQFLVCWCVVVFGFFSLSRSKLGTYVLPMFCPLAVLMAAFLRDCVVGGEADALWRAYVATAALAVVGLVGVPVAVPLVQRPEFTAVVPWMCLVAVVLGAGAVAGLACVRRGRLAASLLAMATGVLLAQGLAIPVRALGREFRTSALVIRAHARPEDLVVIYRSYVQGIAFYARHRTVLVHGRGELRFGSEQGDQRAYFWDTDDQVIDAWRSGRRMFLLGNRDELQALLPDLVPPPRQLAAERNKVLWVNF